MWLTKMKTRDVFGYSFSAIKLRKLRAGLTILGVVIGIAAIVALLSITQGLQSTITLQLETGLAADTLIVTSGRGFLGGGVGMGGGLGGGDSDFRLMINDTATINALSPDIETSVAVIQRSVQIKSADRLVTLNIVGVDFAQYAGIYSSTFVTDNGTISLNPENDTVVIGKMLNDPWKNGTLLFNVNDDVKIIGTNSTARPQKDETYTGHIAAELVQIILTSSFTLKSKVPFF